MAANVEDFQIDFDQEMVSDLHGRIDNVRWPDIGWDTGWGTGTHDDVLRELVDYWRNSYDWRASLEKLNSIGRHVKIQTPGTNELTHAIIYEPPEGVERRGFPLLINHGWPGSVIEFIEAAPKLASHGFTVVTPSLPSFGWSDIVREPGMHPGKIALRLNDVMGALGFNRYGVQGGDWGSIIGKMIAVQCSESVIGLHVNFGTPTPVPAGQEPTQAEQDFLAYRAGWEPGETGYSRLQGTRPQTLGYSQTDSPVGLLAWILEKFWAWTEHDEDAYSLWNFVDKDLFLTNVMAYWTTGRITSAARIYYEMTNIPADQRAVFGQPVTVPTGYAKFPAEPFAPPREMMERGYNLVHYAEYDSGGHFPAVEVSDNYAQDVAKFFTDLD